MLGYMYYDPMSKVLTRIYKTHSFNKITSLLYTYEYHVYKYSLN